MSVAPRSHGEDRALLSTFVVPRFDAHLVQPQPFTTEDAYWQLILARLETRHALQQLRAQQATLLTTARGHAGRAALATLHAHQTTLETQDTHLTYGYRARVACTPPHYPAPRMLRLATRLALTETECDIVHYLVLWGCEGTFPGATTQRCDAGQIADGLALDTHAFFALLNPTSTLLHTEILHVDRRPVGAPRRREVVLDEALMKALRGVTLTDEDFFTLSASPLLEVLLEEPALAHLEVLAHMSDAPHEATVAPSSPTAAAPKTPAGRGRRARPARRVRLDRLPSEEQMPYTSDLVYLQDHLAWFKARARWKTALDESEDATSYDRYTDNLAARLREAQLQERAWWYCIERRLEHTAAAGVWQPRAEQLAARRQLTPFEKHVVLYLTGLTISSAFQHAMQRHSEVEEVGTLLHLFWDSLAEQMTARRHFYRHAPLLQDALIDLHTARLRDDLLHSTVRIDQRMVDYLVGLETEATALVEGSHLYRPAVDLSRVILPEEQKQLILETITGFPAFQQARRRYFDQWLEYGRGLVILFYGPSGSGKTVMANALASHLGQRLLLVNYPRIGEMTSEQTLRFLFREAKIHEAVLFFDECDGIFESRDRHNPEISLILSEIERYDGLIILATNRPAVLDEAMHRRITLAVEFQLPNPAQREHIWRAHLPSTLPCEGSLNLPDLAVRYELSGALIKNAVLVALSCATARNPTAPCLRMADLEQGARLQVRRRLHLVAGEEEMVPQASLEDLIVPQALQEALHDLIGLVKVRRTLIHTWGFTEAARGGLGATALFSGPPGVGKSLAAEAVACELGWPLRRVNAPQVLSKWVGETSQNLEALFREARQHEVVLVFEEAEALFAGRTPVGSSTDRYANLETAVLLREMERYPGVVILTSNLPETIDSAFQRRLRVVLAFPMPDRHAREALWHHHLPARLPLACEVSCAALAAYPLTGAQIRNAVLKAAARAALRPEVSQRVTQDDLATAAEEEGRAQGAPKIVGFTWSAAG